MTTPASSETTTTETVKPVTPAEAKASPKSRVEFEATVKIVNSHLKDGNYSVPVGDKLKPSTIKEVIAEFSAIGWMVKKSTDKASHEVTLKFKEKRTTPAKKRGGKKAAAPAAPVVN